MSRRNGISRLAIVVSLAIATFLGHRLMIAVNQAKESARRLSCT